MVASNREIHSSDKNALYKSIFYLELTILSGVDFIGLVPFEYIKPTTSSSNREAVEGKYPILREIYPGLYSQDAIGCGCLIQRDKLFYTKNGEFFSLIF